MRLLATIAGMLAVLGGAVAPLAAGPAELRVCADPNNLPFSNENGAGFENRLAELIAHEMGRTLSYTWWAQRRGFVRNTLNAGSCDVVISVPAGYPLAATTRPYYRSSYVLVARPGVLPAALALDDPRLRTMKIGVHLLGADGAATPPGDVFAALGLTANVVGYSLYGDYRQASPPEQVLDAVVRGDIDVAAVWGPLAGAAIRSRNLPLAVSMITGAGVDPAPPMQFSIAMGVRKNNERLRAELDEVIARKQQSIDALLEGASVPLLGQTSARSD